MAAEPDLAVDATAVGPAEDAEPNLAAVVVVFSTRTPGVRIDTGTVVIITVRQHS